MMLRAVRMRILLSIALLTVLGVGAGQAQVGDPIVARIQMENTSGDPLTGRTLVLLVNGQPQGTPTESPAGFYVFPPVTGSNPGTAMVKVRVDAASGDTSCSAYEFRYDLTYSITDTEWTLTITRPGPPTAASVCPSSQMCCDTSGGMIDGGVAIITDYYETSCSHPCP